MGDYIRKFDIPAYSNSVIYNKYNVVKRTSGNKEYYFVSTFDGNINQLDTSGLTSNGAWKRFDDFDTDFRDVWTPTFSTSVEVEPRVVNSAMDEGTTLLARDGINTVPLRYRLSFENVNDREAKSLLCFCDYIGASRSFNWTTPNPYNKRMAFSLQSIQHTYLKHNVNMLTMDIERSYVIFGVGAGQQKA